MKRKTLIAMLAAMMALALCMFGVACGIADDEDDSSSGEPHVHVLTAVEATDATCAAEGNVAYFVCECGKLFLDADATTETTLEAVKIAKLAHTYGEWNVTATATCETAGSREKVCSACNDKVTEVVPALGHDEITHAGQAATCTESGWNAYVTCSRCDYTTYTAISALGHDYKPVAEVAATYYKTGVAAHYECAREGCDTKATKSGETYTVTTDADLVLDKKTLLAETTAAERGTDGDYINTIVDAKLKFLDQTTTKYVMTANKNGQQVRAAYFSNSTPWSDADDRVDDGNNNYGFGEFRIALSGNITGISFEYRLVDTGKGVCQISSETDKSYGMKHMIEYSETAGYLNKTKAQYGKEFLTADGAWHTFTLEADGTGMKNVLLKMYHFTGEMLVTNYQVTFAHTHNYIWTTTTAATCEGTGEESGVCDCGSTTTRTIAALGHDYKPVAEIPATYYETGVAAHYVCARANCGAKATKSGDTYTKVTDADLVIEKLTLITGCTVTTEQAGILHIEEKKVKSMVYKGVYNVDGKAAYYFVGDGTQTNSETRFVTEGTNTSLPSADRIYNNYPAKAFSFKYKILNKSTAGVTDGDHWQYIVQILDPSYPILTFEPTVDGEWHEFSYTLSSDQIKLFAGFIVKMGALDGEMLIADINVETHEHVYTWTTTAAATCEGTGEDSGVCDCGSTTTRTIAALGHDYKPVAEVAATYYETGVAAHYECARENCDTKATKSGETYTKVTDAELVLKKLSLIDNATAVATEPENELHLETGKVKEMTFGGWYDVDGKVSYYFRNEKVEGNAETRFVTFGTDTTKKVYKTYVFDVLRVRSFSFEYKIINSCTDGVADKTTVPYITQILGSDGSYDVLEFNPTLNGEWGSYTYTLTDAQIEKFAGFIVKMGGLNGEMLIANIEVDAISLIDGCETATEPEAVLAIEEGKTKQMAYGGLYTVDGKVAYYFHTDLLEKWSETRFITEGTNTKVSGSYVFAPQTITSFSFEYMIRNISKTIITDDGANAPYFAQILCSNGAYYPLALEMVADGKWHTVTYDVPEEQQVLFSGFIVKLGRLKGEMLIANINAEVSSFVADCETATEPDGLLHIETEKVKGMTFGGIYNVDGKVGYYFSNEVVEKNAEARFITEGTYTGSGKRVYNVNPTATKISFEYKFVNLCKTNTPDVLIGSDNMPTILQILEPSYLLNYAFNAVTDGQWHTFEYTLTGADRAKFAGFIVKMGGLNGQLIIANIAVEQYDLVKNYNGVVDEPAGLLHIESGKVKNMSYLGTYNADDKDAYYFAGNGQGVETRFVTEGTFTGDPKDSRVYNVNSNVTKISFSYKVKNTADPVALNEPITGKESEYKANYIVQILEKTYTHNYEFNLVADGEWHTFELVLSDEDRAVFAGFIVKMGAFDGEMLIANINATVVE